MSLRALDHDDLTRLPTISYDEFEHALRLESTSQTTTSNPNNAIMTTTTNPWTAVCQIRDELCVVLADVLGYDYRFVDMRPKDIQTLQPAPGMCPVEGCRTVVFGLRWVPRGRSIDSGNIQTLDTARPEHATSWTPCG